MADVNRFERDLEKAARRYSEGDFKSAYEQYLKLAKEGNGESQVFVGWMLEQGIGANRNSDSAKDWFKRAANLGSLQGAFYYALHLIKHGEYEEAFTWITKAASKGDVPSIFRLGHMYVHGRGTNINIEKGLYYLESAAKQGHIYAKRELTVLDMKGHRGLIKKLLSPINFLYVLFLGLVTVIRDKHSDDIRR
jgi:uncharacterized protein